MTLEDLKAITDPDRLEESTWQLLQNTRPRIIDFLVNMPDAQRADPENLERNLALICMTLLLIRDMKSARPRRTELN